MSNKSPLIATAISSLMILGASGIASQAMAAEGDMEKCFGVAKAGKNDCQTANSSCAGTSKTDGQADAWLFVPAGTCEKLTGGNLEPKTS